MRRLSDDDGDEASLVARDTSGTRMGRAVSVKRMKSAFIEGRDAGRQSKTKEQMDRVKER